jgi:hypothetical protein
MAVMLSLDPVRGGQGDADDRGADEENPSHDAVPMKGDWKCGAAVGGHPHRKDVPARRVYARPPTGSGTRKVKGQVMILRLIAVRIALLVAIAAYLLAAGGAVVGLDWCLARCWPSVSPATGIVLALSAPWAVVLCACLIAKAGRLADRVAVPAGLGRRVGAR